MMVQLRRIWIQLTSDSKRFAVLCTAIGVALLLWARLIVVSNVPRTAIADDPEERFELPSTHDHGQWASENRRQPDAKQVLLSRQPARDPFVISSKHFPKSALVGKSDESLGKFHAEAVEDLAARITAQLQAAVNGLKLEAVMSGPPPMAVIDGTAYRIGDWVPTREAGLRFMLLEVGQRQAVLGIENRRFTLRMESPGQR